MPGLAHGLHAALAMRRSSDHFHKNFSAIDARASRAAGQTSQGSGHGLPGGGLIR
jgi:hypothetical protein